MENRTYDADVRYGSSFLSIGKNKQSVSGEIMTDKLTGEIFIKRPQDDKIISFRQKSHTVYEAIQEFNIQFQSSTGFSFPEDPGSYLLGTKLNVNEFSENDNKKDMLTDNYTFSAEVGSSSDFRFSVSPQTNGFYLKPITRLGDHNVAGYLTGLFSEHEYINFSSTVRRFNEWLDLSTLYESPYLYTEWSNMETWSSSNAMLDYRITVIGHDENQVIDTITLNLSCPIRLDEYNYISFPEEYKEGLQSIYSIDIVITKIYAPKLQYERYLANDSNTPSGISSMVDKLMEIDKKIALQSVDVFYFISDSSMLPSNNNTTINHCFDIDFLIQSLADLSIANGSKAFQSSVSIPKAWAIDGVWAEEIREITNGNQVSETESTTTFQDLERELYHDPEQIVTYTDQIFDSGNILVTSLDI